MLIKLLSNQINEFRTVITMCMEHALPDPDERIKSKLIKEMVMDITDCWISYDTGDSGNDRRINGVILTKITDSPEAGGRVLTVLCGWAPQGTDDKMMLDGFNVLSTYAKSKGCTRLDFYSNNERIIHYANLMPLKWKATYFQFSLTSVEDKGYEITELKEV